MAEQALQESAERLRLAVQASNVGLWDWDLRTNQITYSREWKRQLGYDEHEIGNELGEWEHRLHPDDLNATQERLRQHLDQPERGFEAEFRMRHKDGSWRWICSRGEVLCLEGGIPVRMLGCHLDITDRKQVEDKLKALTGRLVQVQEEERRRLALELHHRIFTKPFNLIDLALAIRSAMEEQAKLRDNFKQANCPSFQPNPLDEAKIMERLHRFAAG